jgi:Sel1 repeat
MSLWRSSEPDPNSKADCQKTTSQSCRLLFQGNAGAQVNLGFFYETGRGGLSKDDREAARLYQLAADQGNAAGRNTLGRFYQFGRGGLPQSDQEAVSFRSLGGIASSGRGSSSSPSSVNCSTTRLSHADLSFVR